MMSTSAINTPTIAERLFLSFKMLNDLYCLPFQLHSLTDIVGRLFKRVQWAAGRPSKPSAYFEEAGALALTPSEISKKYSFS